MVGGRGFAADALELNSACYGPLTPEQELERSNYPTRDLDLHAFGHHEVEIEATLAATAVDGDELDALTQRLAALPAVRQAFRSPSTTE